MATYAEMLAEKIQDVAAENEKFCYHERDREDRIIRFNDAIFDFCRRFHVELTPTDE